MELDQLETTDENFLILDTQRGDGCVPGTVNSGALRIGDRKSIGTPSGLKRLLEKLGSAGERSSRTGFVGD